jgi:hypothetical protein
VGLLVVCTARCGSAVEQLWFGTWNRVGYNMYAAPLQEVRKASNRGAQGV